MAIATTLLQDPQNALTALLSQGIGALNAAVNNAINVGRDRATTQLNQENTVFNVMKNETDLQQRRAENLRRGYEMDRVFNLRAVEAKSEAEARDTAAQQAAQRLELDAQRVGLESQRLDMSRAEAKALAEARTTASQQAGQRLELEAQRTGADILKLQEAQKQTDLLRTRVEDQRLQALGDTTFDALADPQAAKTLTTPDLENYVDFFGGVSAVDPAVAARVNTARRELSRRNPKIDPDTGKPIPDRFSPDKDNPYLGKTTPEEIAGVTQNLQAQIQDLDELIAVAKSKGKTNTGLASLIKTRAELIEQLNKGPAAAINSSPTLPNPANKAGADYYK